MLVVTSMIGPDEMVFTKFMFLQFFMGQRILRIIGLIIILEHEEVEAVFLVSKKQMC